MPVTTIKPSKTLWNGASPRFPWHWYSGGPSVHNVIGDEDGSTYLVDERVGGSWDPEAAVGFNDPGGWPVGSRIEKISTRWLLGMSPEGTGVLSILVDDIAEGAPSQEYFLRPPVADNTGHFITGPSWSTNRVGQDYTPPDIYNLALIIRAGDPYGGGLSDVFVFENYLDLTYRRQGSVTVDSLGGGTVDTSRPTFRWTPAAPDNPGAPQAKWRISVFDEPTYTASGFDPFNHDASVYDSELDDGESGNEANRRSYQNTAFLPTAQPLRAYVYVSQPWPGTQGDWWSYGSIDFEVDLVPVPAPTVTLVADASLAVVSVTVTGHVSTVGTWGAGTYGGGTWGGGWLTVPGSTMTYEIQRTADGGLTWSPVKLPAGFTVDPTSQVDTIVDHLAERGRVIGYRARAILTNPDVGVNTSPWSATATITLAVDGAWIKCPADSTLDRRIALIPPLDITYSAPAAVHDDIIGRRTPIVSAGVAKAAKGTFNLAVDGDSEHDAVKRLIESRMTLLLQDTVGRQWFFLPVGDVGWSLLRAQPVAGSSYPIRKYINVSVPFVEVANA